MNDELNDELLHSLDLDIYGPSMVDKSDFYFAIKHLLKSMESPFLQEILDAISDDPDGELEQESNEKITYVVLAATIRLMCFINKINLFAKSGEDESSIRDKNPISNFN